MRKLLFILGLVLPPVFCTACSDDDEDWKDNSEILGSWTENTDQYEYFEFQFFDDNTGCEICHWGRNSNIDYYFTYRYNAKTKEVFICRKRSIPTHSERLNPPIIIAKMGLKRA